PSRSSELHRAGDYGADGDLHDLRWPTDGATSIRCHLMAPSREEPDMEPVVLRYADCPTLAFDVVIDAPPEAVWQFVSDIQLPARFSSEFDGAEWLDGTGPAAGARFVGRNRHPAIGEWETTSTIFEYEPGSVFGWAVGEPDN